MIQDGRTPLHLAAQSGFAGADAVMALVKAGIGVDTLDKVCDQSAPTHPDPLRILRAVACFV
jgi:hypothetical protein